MFGFGWQPNKRTAVPVNHEIRLQIDVVNIPSNLLFENSAVNKQQFINCGFGKMLLFENSAVNKQ